MADIEFADLEVPRHQLLYLKEPSKCVRRLSSLILRGTNIVCANLDKDAAPLLAEIDRLYRPARKPMQTSGERRRSSFWLMDASMSNSYSPSGRGEIALLNWNDLLSSTATDEDGSDDDDGVARSGCMPRLKGMLRRRRKAVQV